MAHWLPAKESAVLRIHEEVPKLEEVPMHMTDVVWWSYTAFVVLVALFLLWFAFKVRAKGGRR